MTETISRNDIFDKVIEMKDTVSEIIDIVVESLVRQNGIIKNNLDNTGFKEEKIKHVQPKENEEDQNEEDQNEKYLISLKDKSMVSSFKINESLIMFTS